MASLAVAGTRHFLDLLTHGEVRIKILVFENHCFRWWFNLASENIAGQKYSTVYWRAFLRIGKLREQIWVG